MLADADLARVGQLLGDSHRARFLLALIGGQELTAGELAARSGASSSLASAHLSRLLAGGLVSVRKRGRERYYRLGSPEVAHGLEALLTLAPHEAATGLRQVNRGRAIARGRTCYDHLAGRLGVSVAQALEHSHALAPRDHGWELTKRGEHVMGELGVDLEALRGRRRSLLRPCLDWTERRAHLAGSLGAAIAERFFELGWIERMAGSRAVRVTPSGERELLARFAVRV